jgi:glutamate-5-semialdehyde dehydrogenase
LTAGQEIPFGGDRVTFVGDDLAKAFQPGDRLVVVQETGDLLHVPNSDASLAHAAVERADAAFHELAAVSDEQISEFFLCFAQHIDDDEHFAPVLAANAVDVRQAVAAQRSTTRLHLSSSMRTGMSEGLRAWAASPTRREQLVGRVQHAGWRVDAWRAPLGVVGFVFEGRPNVFADAAGVLRTGNTAVFRIGRDALGTASAVMTHCVEPAVTAAGLPEGCLQLLRSPAHAAGWALFSDRRLALAVARGSGTAVAQLGAVARQHGVPASLHGTGGAWMLVGAAADAETLTAAVRHSLDRKVCNTLNVCCVVGGGALLEVVRRAAAQAAKARDATAVVREATVDDDLGHEFEWETDPEFWLVPVDSIDDAVAAFNRHSPRFVASLVGLDDADVERCWRMLDAPFVGNGFTRWVDGQFALAQPELGLSNWQAGRILGRSGIVSGDSVHTVRLRATIDDHGLHR